MDTGTRQRKRPVFAALTALAVAALALLAACSDDSGRDEVAAAPAPANDGVTMRLIAFKPELLTVDAGVTVTWTQQDPGVHTVTSGTVEQGGAGVTTVPDGRFDSGPIATGKTFAFRFDRAGTYAYFCSVHPATMRGEVRVR